MRFEVHGMNVGLTPSLLSHIENRLTISLDCFKDRIRGIVVRLGRDHFHDDHHEMTLKIQVDVERVGTIYLEQNESDLYAAADMAGERLKRVVRRKINRRRAMHRHARQDQSRKLAAVWG
ncbi:HPF/RaiA family ribosome-associated protein [Poriferisphaera sp. WC338]|uniref:HPF/RaiA family ribosome-associated protein n=1 Tax=Poriferisphaera sp. WC338 TaxID=3425129 RepID=UPI003D8190D1